MKNCPEAMIGGFLLSGVAPGWDDENYSFSVHPALL